MRGVRSLVLGTALLAGGAAAQSSPDTIDVIGLKPERAREQAQAFVRATRVADGEQPVARWIDPVCPKAVGISDAIAAKIERRIREVAKAARIKIAPKRCVPNVTVAFTDNAANVVRQVANRSQTGFDNVPIAARAAMYKGNAPIRWWHTAEMRSSDGMRSMGSDAPPGAQIDGMGTLGLGGQVIQQYRSSMLRTQVVRALTSASVVVDVKFAQGKMLDSVADYAALVALAEIRPVDPPPESSILSLFIEGEPLELSALDMNFLEALYRIPLDRPALAQRGLLVRGLMKAGPK
jgi:hypothetical protein